MLPFWKSRGERDTKLSRNKANDELRSLLDDTCVEQQLRQGGEPGIAHGGTGFPDDYLDRWLNAENYNIGRTFRRLVEHGVWRSEFVPNGVIDVGEFEEELAQNKTYMCESCDGLRRPVYITISSRHFRANHNLEQNMRSCVYYMDLALRMGEAMGSDGRVTNIVDCRGVRWENADLVVTQQIHELMTAHYPERLGCVYIYEPPSWFHILWRAMYPLMSEVTRSRIHVLTAAEGWAAHPHLLEVLPEELGGRGKPLVSVLQIAAQYPPGCSGRSRNPHVDRELKGSGSDSENSDTFVDARGDLDHLDVNSLDGPM